MDHTVLPTNYTIHTYNLLNSSNKRACSNTFVHVTCLLWAPAQRKRATMLYFANVFIFYFFMAALFSGPG